MTEPRLIEYTECRNCGVALTAENIKQPLWLKPYCPACWPSECPNCGEPENYTWSLTNERLECDNGCHNHSEIEL